MTSLKFVVSHFQHRWNQLMMPPLLRKCWPPQGKELTEMINAETLSKHSSNMAWIVDRDDDDNHGLLNSGLSKWNISRQFPTQEDFEYFFPFLVQTSPGIKITMSQGTCLIGECLVNTSAENMKFILWKSQAIWVGDRHILHHSESAWMKTAYNNNNG